MKRCDDCKFAEWERTAAGRLSPSKKGRCKFPYVVPKLPNSRYFLGKSAPEALGGHIKRGEQYNAHCPYYQPSAT